MVLRFDEDPLLEAQWGSALLCPGCDSEWTHIDQVICEARYEDDPITQIRLGLVPGDVTMEPTTVREGKSRRRHSVTLLMWCEICSHEYGICFAQHKGNTFVTTEDLGHAAGVNDHGVDAESTTPST